MPIKLNTASGGGLILQGANTASDKTITIPAADGNMQLIQQATAVTASGTAIDFTGIPSWAKRITVMFNGVSTNGTSNILIRFGAGAIDTSGYASVYGQILGTNSTSIGTDTTGHIVSTAVSAATDHSGTAILTNISGASWLVNQTSRRNDGIVGTCVTTKTLSGTLDRVRVTTVNGTDTFDAGTINIMYEG